MKFFTTSRSRAKWAAVLAPVVLAGAVLAEQEFSEMKGFRIPEYDESGAKTSELTGDLARMKGGGDVEITNLKIEFYDGDEIKAEVTSPKCIYNQDKEVATSESTVRLSRENMVVTGKGFAYSRGSQLFKIYSEAKVVIKDVQRHVGADK